MASERRSVHVSGDQRVRIGGFLDRDAANERRHLAGNFIETAKHYMLAGRFYSRPLEQIAQARSGEASRSHRAALPLHARNLGLLKTASVSRALQCVGDGVRLQFRQVGQS